MIIKIQKIWDIWSAIHARIKITQAQLAAAAGVGVRFIVDLESGKETIALNKALKVLTVLGLDTEVK